MRAERMANKRRATLPAGSRKTQNAPCPGASRGRGKAEATGTSRNTSGGQTPKLNTFGPHPEYFGPHPEEARSAVSKDGSAHLPCIHPSRRALRALLRMRSEYSHLRMTGLICVAG